MNEVIEKIITDIEIHKGRKYCANIHQTLRDDGYVPSICNFVRSVRPEKVTKLIAYIRQLEKQVAEGEQLKQRLDAVVAECARVKLIAKDLASEAAQTAGEFDDLCAEIDTATPNVTAALAEVEAKAIEKAIERITILMNHQAPAVAQVINTLQMYAKSLREGRV